MDDGYNRCVMCGIPIPEGGMVCKECEAKYSRTEKRKTCETPGVEIRIGNIPVDPCIYEETETIHNATVHILRCKNCGKIEIEWERGTEDD